MQEVVDALKAKLCMELLFENALQVGPPQRADAVGLGGPGVDALLERLDPVFWEARGAAGLLVGVERLDAAVAVGVAPVLGEPPASVDGCGDVLLAAPLDGEDGDAEAVTLEGFSLTGREIAEAAEVVGFSLGDVDGGAPGCGAAG